MNSVAVSGVLASGVVALTVRMLVSLGVVLAVIAVGYVVARRRAGRPSGASGRGRRGGVSKIAGRLAGARPNGARSARPAGGLEVVGRVGLTRGAAAVAVRFGDRVVLLAAGETGNATAVAEMPASQWEESQLVREPLEFPVQRTTTPSEPRVVAPDPTARPGFVEALRMATARRG